MRPHTAFRASAALAAVLITATAAPTLRGQAQRSNAQAPAFEVVSIKPNTTPDGGGSSGFRPGGTYRVVNGVVFGIIAVAFGADQPLHASQVIGAPDWAHSSRFDVTAKALDPDATPRDMLPMLQAMLADRFKLQAHRETRQLPVYALVKARADGRLGPQLRPSSIDCEAVARARREGTPLPADAPADRPACGYAMRGERDGIAMRASGLAMDRLVSILSLEAERLVIDRTGITGLFDVDLQWDFTRTGAPNDAPTIFTAAQEQLGLKLESERAPVDVVVIDHIEPPTPD